MSLWKYVLHESFMGNGNLFPCLTLHMARYAIKKNYYSSYKTFLKLKFKEKIKVMPEGWKILHNLETSNESCDTNVKIEKTKDQKEIQNFIHATPGKMRVLQIFYDACRWNASLYSYKTWSTYSKSLRSKCVAEEV